jgi:hypothetical protein
VRQLVQHQRQAAHHRRDPQVHQQAGEVADQVLRAGDDDRVGQRGAGPGLEQLEVVVRLAAEDRLIGRREDIPTS